jgi:hypothetical protein
VAIDWAALKKANAAALKKVDNGGSVPYKYTKAGSRAFIVIGDEKKHAPANVQMMGTAKSFYSGVIKVKKGSLTDPGTLTVSGCKANRAEFEEAISEFSKKKVNYAG